MPSAARPTKVGAPLKEGADATQAEQSPLRYTCTTRLQSGRQCGVVAFRGTDASSLCPVSGWYLGRACLEMTLSTDSTAASGPCSAGSRTPRRSSASWTNWPTTRSPAGRPAIRRAGCCELGTAHCMDGALLAAAALRVLGHPPLLVDLEAVRDDDHVLAVFREDGALGRGGQVQLRRAALPRADLPDAARAGDLLLRALLQPSGEKTLRRYSRPVNLRRFDRIGWMTSRKMSRAWVLTIPAAAFVAAVCFLPMRLFVPGMRG